MRQVELALEDIAVNLGTEVAYHTGLRSVEGSSATWRQIPEPDPRTHSSAAAGAGNWLPWMRSAQTEPSGAGPGARHDRPDAPPQRPARWLCCAGGLLGSLDGVFSVF